MPEVNMKDTFSTYHPLLNMLYFVGVIGVTVFVVHPVILAISLFGGIAYSVLLKGWKKTVKFNLIFSIPMMLIVALMNPMFNHYGVTIIGYLHNGNPFTLESCVYGLVMAMMLVCTMIWFSCYTIVMTSDKFIYLFGKIIPALSLVLSMCLRFVPKFIREAGVISDGQKCIGRSTENGSLVKRAKHGITIFSILVTWALENAIETSDSMRSRGYGLRGRTAFSVYRFTKRDCCLGTLMAGLFAVFTAGCASGAAYAVYDPRIVLAGFTVQGSTAPVSVTPWLAGATYLCFGIFCFLPVMLELYESRKLKQSRKKTGTDIGMTYRQIYEELEQEGKIL